MLKEKTRRMVYALNGDDPNEKSADNLAVVRICEIVTDILVAFKLKRLMDMSKRLV